MVPPDIERGAAEPIGAQCLIERLLVDDRRAADVDQERGRLHQRQSPGVEQPLGLRPEPGRDQQRIASRQHAVELGEWINLRGVALVGDRAAIGGDNLAAEASGTFGDLSADPSVTDDADRLAEHLAMRRAAGWWAAQDPPRKLVTVSKSRWVRASIVISTYSAIAGSWPKALHRMMPRGRDGRSIMSTPAVAACSSFSRGTSGKSARQMWPTMISASANAGIRRCVSVRSAREVGSTSSVILARMRGATRAASPPRNKVFMTEANPYYPASFETRPSGAPQDDAGL